MSRVAVAFIALALVGRVPLDGREPFRIPAWLQPYPGANEEVETSRGRAVATYETYVSLDEMVAFHRGRFAAQNIPFEPEIYGNTALIRANPEGCSLTIQIRKTTRGMAVQITASERPVIPKLTESDIRQSMEKYDQPVNPAPRVPLPALRWPSWLTTYGTGESPVHNGVDRFRNQYLESEFDAAGTREAIQAYYADLLKANDYRVTMESSPITPPGRPSVVEGTRSFDHSGRFVIRIDLTPTARDVHVTLRITAHP